MDKIHKSSDGVLLRPYQLDQLLNAMAQLVEHQIIKPEKVVVEFKALSKMQISELLTSLENTDLYSCMKDEVIPCVNDLIDYKNTLAELNENYFCGELFDWLNEYEQVCDTFDMNMILAYIKTFEDLIQSIQSQK